MIDREGHHVAKALSAKGVTAFVLKYRLPDGKTMRERSIGPLQDAQQAVLIIRKRAKEFNVNAAKIGIMGFSAGGHLAASAGILSDKSLIPGEDSISVRPDFMILVYPVITMDTVEGHKGSTFNLLGPAPDDQDIRKFSLHLHVSDSVPPAFITVAANDKMLKSSLLLFDALQKESVPCELHVYSTGGHGFLKYPPFGEWTKLFLNWMKINNWIE